MVEIRFKKDINGTKLVQEIRAAYPNELKDCDIEIVPDGDGQILKIDLPEAPTVPTVDRTGLKAIINAHSPDMDETILAATLDGDQLPAVSFSSGDIPPREEGGQDDDGKIVPTDEELQMIAEIRQTRGAYYIFQACNAVMSEVNCMVQDLGQDFLQHISELEEKQENIKTCVGNVQDELSGLSTELERIERATGQEKIDLEAKLIDKITEFAEKNKGDFDKIYQRIDLNSRGMEKLQQDLMANNSNITSLTKKVGEMFGPLQLQLTMFTNAFSGMQEGMEAGLQKAREAASKERNAVLEKGKTQPGDK